jgi:ribosomal protein S18 acetylase RimI-like enzyme
VKIEWCRDKERIQALISFFIENVDPSYISHGEIQTGRALDRGRWSPALPRILRDEFDSYFEKGPVAGDDCKVAVATTAGEISALLIVKIQTMGEVPYSVLSDFIVKRESRGQGVGRAVFAWLQAEMKKAGIGRIFLESGQNNERAHRFFKSQGFAPCSILMLKEVAR